MIWSVCVCLFVCLFVWAEERGKRGKEGKYESEGKKVRGREGEDRERKKE